VDALEGFRRRKTTAVEGLALARAAMIEVAVDPDGGRAAPSDHQPL